MYRKILVAFAVVLATPMVHANDQKRASNGVPILPVYVNEEGHGILRYSAPGDRAGPVSAALGGLFPENSRPFEVFSTMGTWTGPDISLCLQYYTREQVDQMNMAIQLYSRAEEEAIAYYRIVFDAEQAEDVTSTEGGTGPGECSSDFLM